MVIITLLSLMSIFVVNPTFDFLCLKKLALISAHFYCKNANAIKKSAKK